MNPELLKLEEGILELKKLTLLSAKDVLSIEDVSYLTGLSVPRLYTLTCNKQIPFYKREGGGKKCYFDKKEINDWMKTVRVATLDESVQNAAAEYANRSVSL